MARKKLQITVHGLLKIDFERHFEKTGSFDVQSGRGRNRIDSTVVERVASAVPEESNGGVKRRAARI